MMMTSVNDGFCLVSLEKTLEKPDFSLTRVFNKFSKSRSISARSDLRAEKIKNLLSLRRIDLEHRKGYWRISFEGAILRMRQRRRLIDGGILRRMATDRGLQDPTDRHPIWWFARCESRGNRLYTRIKIEDSMDLIHCLSVRTSIDTCEDILFICPLGLSSIQVRCPAWPRSSVQNVLAKTDR